MRMLIMAVLATGAWAQQVTVESLPQFLAQAGYRATKIDDHSYTVTEHLGNHEFEMDICLSSSGRRVWLGAFIKGMSNPAQISDATYQRLMMANDEQGPGTFSIVECPSCTANNRYKLYFDRPIDNRRLTVDVLHQEIKLFLESLAATENIWADK